jgi:hypothetical protein
MSQYDRSDYTPVHSSFDLALTVRGAVGQLFKIDKGDGDPSFFNHPFVARRIEEDWFSGILYRGPAFLLKVESGMRTGQYIAITSRAVASLENQLEESRWISVVVHLIKRPGEEFLPTLESADAVGMAAIEAIGPV